VENLLNDIYRVLVETLLMRTVFVKTGQDIVTENVEEKTSIETKEGNWKNYYQWLREKSSYHKL
jgi:hypothetical protein